MLTQTFLNLLLIGLYQCGDALGLKEETVDLERRAPAENPNALSESDSEQTKVLDDMKNLELRLPISSQDMHQLRAALNLNLESKENGLTETAGKNAEVDEVLMAGPYNGKGSAPILIEKETKEITKNIMTGPYKKGVKAENVLSLENMKEVSKTMIAGPYKNTENAGWKWPPWGKTALTFSLRREEAEGTDDLVGHKAPGPFFVGGNSEGSRRAPKKVTLIFDNKKTEKLSDDGAAPLEFSVAKTQTETMIGERAHTSHALAKKPPILVATNN